jgi:hypothetical protein
MFFSAFDIRSYYSSLMIVFCSEKIHPLWKKEKDDRTHGNE